MTLPAHSVTVIVMPQQLNSDIGNATDSGESFHIDIVPNPSQNLAQLIIHTPASNTEILLELRNILGEIIIPTFRWRTENNRTFIPVNTSILSNGQYYWIIKDLNGKSHTQFMQVRN